MYEVSYGLFDQADQTVDAAFTAEEDKVGQLSNGGSAISAADCCRSGFKTVTSDVLGCMASYDSESTRRILQHFARFGNTC